MEIFLVWQMLLQAKAPECDFQIIKLMAERVFFIIVSFAYGSFTL